MPTIDYLMAIQIKKLSKRYRNVQILKDISVTIPQGRLSALLGPNGSGKSTLMKSILGIIRTSPTTSIQCEPEIGYMSQHPAFPRYLTVLEVIRFFCELNPPANLSYKEKLMEEMAITTFQHKRIRELSPGMRQKLNIMQCFMWEPNVFLLDEPSAGLDLQMTHYLKNLLKEKKRQGKTILYTSHVMSEVETLADEMLMLHEGIIALQIAPKTLIKREKSTNLEGALLKWWEKQKSTNPS